MAASNFTIEFDFRGVRYQNALLGLKAFAARTGRLLDSAPQSLSGSMRWYLNNVAKALGKSHGNGWPGGTTHNTLSRRSGALTKSIEESVAVEGTTLENLRGKIGSALVYGRIQEFGGTITPRAAKYLTVPLPAALNADGTPIKKSAREWANTFVATSKAGNLIVFQRRGKQIIPLYVLKSKVTIPPRLGMGKTIETGMGLFVDRALSDMLKAIKKAP